MTATNIGICSITLWNISLLRLRLDCHQFVTVLWTILFYDNDSLTTLALVIV